MMYSFPKIPKKAQIAILFLMEKVQLFALAFSLHSLQTINKIKTGSQEPS
jgi:hypothetical protein